MREQWKRNAVVATVLLFVCAAVYLNWRYAGNVAEDAAPAGTQSLSSAQNDQGGGSEKDGGVTTKVLGDAALVGGVPTVIDSDPSEAAPVPAPASSYFDTARLSRQQSRDNALSLLREASAQENVDQAALDDANRAIQTLAGTNACITPASRNPNKMYGDISLSINKRELNKSITKNVKSRGRQYISL